MALLLVYQAVSASADTVPLQGGIEEDSTMNSRIARPSTDTLLPGIAIQGNAPPLAPSFRIQAGATTLSSVVNNNAFVPADQVPLSAGCNVRQPIIGNAASGQDEWWVNWDEWRHRVTDTVWAPLHGAMLYGQTRVDYDVTRDHRIRITNVCTPDPTGMSGRIVAGRIMQLDGDPILEFPTGSQQQIHHNFNMVSGRPFLERLSGPLYLPGGMEHVVKQW
jgi:hypothetical protein